MSSMNSNWVRVGKKLEADVFVDLETGRVKHVGSELADPNKPRVYDGQPSVRGYWGAKILQVLLGRKRDE